MITAILYTEAEAQYAREQTYDTEGEYSWLSPREVTAPAPYPYAGLYVTGAAVLTDPQNAGILTWLSALPTAEIVVSEAFPPIEDNRAAP